VPVSWFLALKTPVLGLIKGGFGLDYTSDYPFILVKFQGFIGFFENFSNFLKIILNKMGSCDNLLLTFTN